MRSRTRSRQNDVTASCEEVTATMSDWLRGDVEDFVFTNENVFFEVQKRAGVKETGGISVVVCVLFGPAFVDSV